MAKKITLAKYGGFCFGVKRAIELAEKSLLKNKDIFICGDIVHNELVSEKLKKKGLKKVSSLREIPKNKTLIIKAHGEGLSTYQEAKNKDLKIIDATCPMVADIHKKAKNLEKQGYLVVIIGDKNHDETKGIKGHLKNSLVVEKKDDIKTIKNKLRGRISVVVQSTQDIENVREIIFELIPLVKELVFVNTICLPTKRRQEEVQWLAKTNEAIAVVGSKTSANTKRLFLKASQLNKNTFWIKNNKDPQIKKLLSFNKIGIIGGASTPDETLKEIYTYLNKK